MTKFTQLKGLIENAEFDAQKFYQHSNHAAGTRLRNNLQQIKKIAQEIRQEVSELKVSSQK
jgi:hypothetical protein